MKPRLHLLAFVAVLLSAGAARAAFHLMEIEQVIGGVGGDTTAQAVQLKMRAAGQTALNGPVQLCAYDAAGANPVRLSTFGAAMMTSGICREILLATDNFAARTTPPAVRDFQMTASIPSGYLAAGSLTFEPFNTQPCGVGTPYWRVSWGGASYTGSGSVQTVAAGFNDDDGTANPAAAGPLPSTGTKALRFTPACPPGGPAPASTTNASQYAPTAGTATLTNNALTNFTINAIVASVPALESWGWVALAAALGAVGLEVARKRIA